jgi:multiple antibiotic resistance protein
VSLITMAITFFLVANPIGNSPAIIALIKDLDFERQKRVMLRESLLALFLALFFQYLGKLFLGQLEINIFTLRISGGILLLIVSLGMIFSSSQKKTATPLKREPLFVPIATPLITGPGLLTIIMFVAQQEQNNLKVTLAIGLTWIGVTASLLAAPYLNKILKRRGLIALEQLMGLFLTLMATSMIIKGFVEFTHSIPKD